jgi:SAM-dependent methyltransferase
MDFEERLYVMSDLISEVLQMRHSNTAKKILRCGRRIYHRFRTRSSPAYRNPTESDLIEIERRIQSLNMSCHDLVVDSDEFMQFVQQAGFPPNYHGGITGGVYIEKLLEHFVAWKLLTLGESFHTPYVDVAACSSPWAKILRRKGIESYAIDLSVPLEYSCLSYYRREDATKTSFKDGSIGGVSLQCAYEMFVGHHDIELLKEFGRILKPGGRAVISPLYTHTHPCYYQTPEHYGKPYGDPGAQGYVRRDCWEVPSSRKYSPETLKTRVWDNAIKVGLEPNLHVLRNKHELPVGIYLHFILVLDKRLSAPRTV